MGINEFGSRPPEVKPLPPVPVPKDRKDAIDEAKAAFGFDKVKVTEIRAPHEPQVQDRDRRTATQRALDHQLPIPTVGRAAYERSPVHELEKFVAQQGMSPEAFREGLRLRPDLLNAAGLAKNTVELLTDYAKVGTVPFQRFAMPKSPEVDALVHKAAGKQPDEYVSQRDLDTLLKTAVDHRGDLVRKGLTEGDVDRVRGYLVGETGRTQTTDFAGRTTSTTSDGHWGLSPEDAVRHDRWRMVNATVEAPLTTGVAREMGAGLDKVEGAAHGAATIERLVGAYVLHTATVRAGLDAAKQPAGPPRIVPEAPKAGPERSAGPKDSGSYAKELFSIRDKAYDLALADAKEVETNYGQRLTAAQFGTRVHVNFGELANHSVREGRLPQSFTVNVQSKLDAKAYGLDAWDKATGIGFDVTTATTRSVLGHEKHVGVPAHDGTDIHEYLPLVYPSFKETKKILDW